MLQWRSNMNPPDSHTFGQILYLHPHIHALVTDFLVLLADWGP
jgi:hypothetical protein